MKTRAEYNRQHYQIAVQRRSSFGLCLCGKFPVAPARRRCKKCLEKINARNAAKRNSGLCQCGEKPKPNHKKCVSCLQEAKRRRVELKQKGLCDCGAKSLGNSTTCQSCTSRKTVRRRNNKAKGFCGCGRIPVENKKMCSRCQKRRNKQHAIRSKTDQRYVAEKKIRGAIFESIQRIVNAKKKDRTEKLLGCTLLFARKHIESLFLDGMTWANRHLWQIDHYIPCSAFDLTQERQQRLCNNWRNLRPLWSTDNREKWDTLPFDYAVRLAELEAHVPPDMSDPMF